MKILMTTYTTGVVWTYVMNLCKSLERYNVEIHLLSMGKLLNKEQSEQINLLNNVNIYESSHKLDWMCTSAEDFTSAKQWVAHKYETIQPDLIHFNNYGQTMGVWNCPVITVYHFCVLTWWISLYNSQPPAKWTKYIESVRNAIRISNVVVAPSESMLKLAEEANGEIPQSHIINYGSDNGYLEKVDNQYIVLSAGCLNNEAKNIQLLLKIAKNIEWPVCIAGNYNSVEESNIANAKNVFFLGELSKVHFKNYMDRSAIFVMPAKYEPFGFAVLEAAKSNCALVLANIPSLVEIWGDAAIYFDPNDESDAQEAISLLIKDEQLRSEMTKRAFERSKEFTADRMADEYVDLYESLVIHSSKKIASGN